MILDEPKPERYKLFIKGRHTGRKEYAMEFNKKTFHWKVIGDAALNEISDGPRAIMKRFRNRTDRILRTGELAKDLKRDPASISRDLKTLQIVR